MQIPVLLGATLITRFIIYEFIFNMYIPGYLLLRYAALAFYTESLPYASADVSSTWR